MLDKASIMKNFILILTFMAVALLLVRCGPPKDREKPGKGVNNTLVSDLALRALLQQPSDPASCALASRMSDVVHRETNDRQQEEMLAFGICCCPCDEADTTAYDTSDPVPAKPKASFISVAPQPELESSGNNCPCPSIAEWFLAARKKYHCEISIDDIVLEKTSEESGEWEMFRLGEDNAIQEGNHVLKINGDFLDEDSIRVYNLNIVIGRDGKPYMQ